MMEDVEGLKDVVERIWGLGKEVYDEYHGGLLESAYEAALCYLLRKEGYVVEDQKKLPLYFKGVLLDRYYVMDVVVERRIILELKAVDKLEPAHRFQLFNYLRLTHAPIGVLINFSPTHGYYVERYCYDKDTNKIIGYEYVFPPTKK